MTPRFLPDANIYLNALHSRSAHHAECRNWLDQTTAARHRLLLNDLTECAFLRISTLPRLNFASLGSALEFWDRLLDYSGMERATPGPAHAHLFRRLLKDLGLAGNEINDVWLAALCLENDATLVSTDQGFSRFPGLKWLNPAQ
ncbi:MAG TPA: TA system VapC family ribonuclease toxin [Chthoniobacterales bacterium]